MNDAADAAIAARPLPPPPDAPEPDATNGPAPTPPGIRPRVERPASEPTDADEIDRRVPILFLIGITLTGLSLVLHEWSRSPVVFALTVLGVAVLGAALGVLVTSQRRT